MKISFDLDDTIISNNRFPLEKETFGLKLSDARIRSGTVALFKALRTENIQFIFIQLLTGVP
jgi:hypothetical protein